MFILVSHSFVHIPIDRDERRSFPCQYAMQCYVSLALIPQLCFHPVRKFLFRIPEFLIYDITQIYQVIEPLF